MTGKNCSIVTINTTPKSRVTKSGPWVGKVPAESGAFLFRTTDPAMAISGMTCVCLSELAAGAWLNGYQDALGSHLFSSSREEVFDHCSIDDGRPLGTAIVQESRLQMVEPEQ